MNKSLPIYNLTFNANELESGILAISLVDEPAIEKAWFAFAKENEKQFTFQVVNTDKQILAGYFLVPDKLIYRKDSDTNFEYFVRFDTDTISALAEKFNKNLLSDNFNINHNDQNTTQAFVKENWIIENAEFDKSKIYGFTPIVGAWFGLVKIEDNNVWNNYIKTGQLTGFSIEGLFEMELTKLINQSLTKTEIKPADKISAYLKKYAEKKQSRKNIIQKYLSIKNKKK